MSALAQLREVMVTSRDLIKDYDSDDVSLTSTVVEEDGDYISNGIIAECSEQRERYLSNSNAVFRCTWEPPYNLDGTILIPRWEELKKELGTAAFQRENEANRKAYEEAQAKAQAAKARRHAKRERERQKRLRQTHTVISDADSSDDEPLISAHKQESLFVEDHAPSSPASCVVNPTRKCQAPVARRPPLQQSSSEEDSSSDCEIPDHPEIRAPQKSDVKHKHDHNAAKESRHDPVLPKSKPELSKPTTISTASVVNKNLGQTSRASSATSANTVAKHGTPAVSSVQGKPIDRSSATSNTMRAIRTAPSKQVSRAIGFINEPKEKQKKQWSTDQHYTKAGYRWRAEKRSRTEGTPDFSALSFVNGPPPTLPKATVSRSNDNPYGRRETANHRVQDEEKGDEVDRPRRGLTNVTGALAAWEANKVPLVCYHWKSSTCPRTARDCRFMHRETDPEGKPYRLGDFDGRVPHKYHRPPITCPYWYKGRKCIKTEEECSYAHKDTGWAEINGVPTEIACLPPSYLAPIAPSHSKIQDPPTTCPFWLWKPQGCNKSAEVCKYAHRNTGWVRSESDPKAPPMRIDPDLEPRSRQPKYASPPVTCPHWLNAERGCTRADDECRYAHRNTGWAPPGLSHDRALPIDPQKLPYSERLQNGEKIRPAVQHDRAGKPPDSGCVQKLESDRADPKNRKPPITCFFWLNGPSGCVKLAANCRFAHKNTGWIIRRGEGHNAKPEQIDSMALPRFRKPGATETAGIDNDQTNSMSQLSSRTIDGATAAPTSIPVTSNTMNGTVQGLGTQYVQSSLEIPKAAPKEATAVPMSSEIRSKIESIYNLDIIDMFCPLFSGDDTLERQAMLLFDPKEHPEDVELITRWLLLHKVKVTNLWYSGAWSQFRDDVAKHKSGVIVVHPDFDHYVNLPGFGDILKQRVRVWSVGLQPPAEFVYGVQPDLDELKCERIGLFPHGGLIYITDDVFERKPQCALSIVKLFFAKIEQLRRLDGPDSWWLRVDDAYLLWRLCVRPELMEHLRVDLYQLLTLTHYIEQDNPLVLPSTVQDKYPILSHRREIAEHPSINYFNLLEHSQVEANTQMIGHYAAMHSAFLRRDYRHFYVVHTEPNATCALEWKASIHTITDIITPEQCIEELTKPSKGSMFDFLDWALKPKDKELDAMPEEAQ
ncbi:hypothetical protein SVAN01_01844 [Stagonosporopsis vannaccii]|nr:hypothetical protein SVAN01_01844 [Stagonosporopsis vannaccii]